MLEARNLVKKYKTKNGPTVNALDDVSIKFEETGMVFILGKSGSGKSTLLNVLGGLDKYDSGEVIVKGKSSRDFKQADFDSYRNTFIGFIFQDYNILEEFTVAKNIGLALELQGKKADKKTINALIEQVDLKGFARRKPNTLSGGQKQRVAIARALVKNPEIIMADEPTGALDSNTGKQVLDTLKELSKTKLVLIVSHDREFAEQYGDRIIELADGKIISDIVKYKSAPKESNGLEIVDDKVLTIKKGVKLDTVKAKALVEFISRQENDVIVSVDEKANKEFKKFARIDDEGNKESFKNTENLNIKEYDGNNLKLIRSKMPGKDSFKMGASGLKSKPIRLIFTIILSAIAFAMFGLADTMGSYDKVETTTQSIMDSQINYATFSKKVKRGDEDYSYYNETLLSNKDLEEIKNKIPELNFSPVFKLKNNNTLYLRDFFYDTSELSYDSIYKDSIDGFIEITNQNVSNFGSVIEGRLPVSDDEIVITKYMYDIFKELHYKDVDKKVEINTFEDLKDKVIGYKYTEYPMTFKIVGVIDTNCDLSRYEVMKQEGFGQNGMTDIMIAEEFREFISKSYHNLGYLNKGYMNRNVVENGLFSTLTNNNPDVLLADAAGDMWGNSIYKIADYSSISNVSEINKNIKFFNPSKTSVNNNEIVLSYNYFYNLELDIDGEKKYVSNMLNSWCITNDFDTKFNALLETLEKQGYSWQILNYYGAFNDEIYEMNDLQEPWWNDSYKMDLTNEEKDAIHNFLSTYQKPTYCIDIKGYMSKNNTVIFSKILAAYNIRVDAGEEWGNYSSRYNEETNEWEEVLDNKIEYYISELYDQFGNSNNDFGFHYNKEYAPLTSEEKAILKELKYYVIERVEPYVNKNAWVRDNYNWENPTKLTLVGVYVSDEEEGDSWSNTAAVAPYLLEHYKHEIGGVYAFMIANLDYNNEDVVNKLVNLTYEEGEVKYTLNNTVMSSMEQINNLIETLSQVFLYVGIGFAVFASLLLLNFITISISYKKREIGVLRAIGARGRDVFKIFFNEAFIIAFINFVLASVASVATCIIINGVIRNDYGMLITILNIGPRQIILMFLVSLLVAFLSSFLPVRKIARKKPIDAIRNT